MKTPLTSLLFLVVLWLSCCASDTSEPIQDEAQEMENPMETLEGVASVTDLAVSGEENQYSFNVTIASDDLGCQQYADWWEVIDTSGKLLYRRILAHSHVNEQPFTRSGGPIAIDENTEVYIRAHMNTTGYGEKALKGSVKNGFTAFDLDIGFAAEVLNEAPLPNGCAF